MSPYMCEIDTCWTGGSDEGGESLQLYAASSGRNGQAQLRSRIDLSQFQHLSHKPLGWRKKWGYFSSRWTHYFSDNLENLINHASRYQWVTLVLVGGLVAIFYYWEVSSSQLTKSYFSEGWPNHQPATLIHVARPHWWKFSEVEPHRDIGRQKVQESADRHQAPRSPASACESFIERSPGEGRWIFLKLLWTCQRMQAYDSASTKGYEAMFVPFFFHYIVRRVDFGTWPAKVHDLALVFSTMV